MSAEAQDRMSRRAAMDWPALDALQGAATASLTPARRIARAQAQAKAAGLDIDWQLRVVRLAMAQGRSERHVDRRLSAVEARLRPDRTV